MSTVLMFLLLAGSWQARPPAAIDDVCRTVRCRDAKVVQLELPDGSTAQVSLPRSPIVRNESVGIYVGEHLVLALEPIAGGKFRVSAPDKEPPKGQKLDLVFRQEQLKAGEPKAMLLVATSSVAKTIHFKASIVTGPNDTPQPTSICPLPTNVASYETWPGPIVLLLLRDFVVVPDGTPCK